MMTPFGPFSKLVVRIVGSLKSLAVSARARTLFLNSSGVILDQRQQTGLVVDQQHGGGIDRQAGVSGGHRSAPFKEDLCMSSPEQFGWGRR